MRQSWAFLDGEAKAWLDRNKDKLPVKNDPVVEAIKELGLSADFAVEVGCANGWRLRQLRELWPRCSFIGIDPLFVENIDDGNIWLRPGTAGTLQQHIGIGDVDIVIFGFCLYLCDPEDYFAIAKDADAVLKDGGFLIVYDFTHPLLDPPYKVPYHHKPGLFSYHMDFANLWLSHPAYSRIYRKYGPEWIAVTVLQKNMKSAFVLKEQL